MEWIVFWCMGQDLDLRHMLYHRQFHNHKEVLRFAKVNAYCYDHSSLILSLEDHPEMRELPDQFPDNEPYPMEEGRECN